MSQISCVGLVTGPGSFTGLRVGVGTAKAIAYARKIPVVEADTLDVIRWQWEQLTTPCQIPYVHVVLDAYRGELFTKSFARGQVVSPTRTVGVGQFVVEMRSHDSRSDQHAVVGPGCERIDRFLTKENHDESLGEWVKGTCWFSGSETAPHASGVSHECLEKWLSGDILDPFSLAPRYFRGSAAEEKARKV